ncbi:MAG: DUF5522 domain-containing protein [Phycisphaerales bacterium JB038]
MDSPREGVDYYLDEQGRTVFTAYFLLKRGYCCISGCRHCPYDENGDPRPEYREEHPDLCDPKRLFNPFGKPDGD